MRQFLIFILLALLCTSCDKTEETMRIIIKNDRSYSIKVQLFPKSEYLSGSGETYCAYSTGYGYSETEFELGTDSLMDVTVKPLFSSYKIDLSATDLVAQVFDSIHITSSDGQESIIRFTHNTVSGYDKNLFTDDSAWSYELNNYDEPVGLSTTHIEAHEYTFTFKEENIE